MDIYGLVVVGKLIRIATRIIAVDQILIMIKGPVIAAKSMPTLFGQVGDILGPELSSEPVCRGGHTRPDESAE